MFLLTYTLHGCASFHQAVNLIFV